MSDRIAPASSFGRKSSITTNESVSGVAVVVGSRMSLYQGWTALEYDYYLSTPRGFLPLEIDIGEFCPWRPCFAFDLLSNIGRSSKDYHGAG
jgi:hypothetical protein